MTTRGTARPLRGPLVSLLTLAVATTALLGQSVGGPGAGVEPEKLVFLLQYIGADYGTAVRNGRVINTFEYQEMVSFTKIVVDEYERLHELGASGAILDRLRELHLLIWNHDSWDEVRALTRELVPALAEELNVSAWPASRPDLDRGAAIYATDCAPCHGPRGGGDGPSAAGQHPPPSSFREARMNLLSPHQVYSATELGIQGTAMPSWRGSRPPAQLWDVAFHVMTLRKDFAAARDDPGLAVVLPDLARFSNDELLGRLRVDHPDVSSGDLDYYRRNPPSLRPREILALARREVASSEAELPFDPDADLQVAMRLQTSFTRIAEQTFPSVVGVTIFTRDDGWTAERLTAERAEAWQRGQQDELRYPGFRPVGRGSGFFVSPDGYLLTCHHVLIDPGTDAIAERIDVELHDQRRQPARVIGVEPTINVAVLKIEAPFEVEPAPFANDTLVRVGHWAVALGDPPGVEKTFAAGTISARPERDCYQEQRTATLFQTSLQIGRESYGGPLLNIRGEVIGVSVPRDASDLLSGGAPFGALYGLPIDLVTTIYDVLKERESRRSPWLGISVLPINRELRRRSDSSPMTGVYIDDVFDPGPGSRAGIRVGDFLVSMDGNRLFAVPDFQKWLYLLGIGKTITVEIFRDGETFEREVTIEQRPTSATTR